MIVHLENEYLSLEADTRGAQLTSIRDMQGCEYLWQGDARYWPDRAPVLFPFIGRLFQNRWQNAGKEYTMGIHGFASLSDFSVKEYDAEHMILSIGSSGETYASYPFAFALEIGFELRVNSVIVSFCVTNPGSEMLPFAIGGHPGFNVPLDEGFGFEDYVLEFSRKCQPDRVGFSADVLLDGRDMRYGLEGDRCLFLRHELFDDDAIILKNMAHEITLRAVRPGRAVKLSFPDMPYLGIWHRPKTDAPYVCIEPWTSLPARQDVVEDFSNKSDMIHLAPGCTYRNIWSITIIQETEDYD